MHANTNDFKFSMTIYILILSKLQICIDNVLHVVIIVLHSVYNETLYEVYTYYTTDFVNISTYHMHIGSLVGQVYIQYTSTCTTCIDKIKVCIAKIQRRWCVS